MSALPKSLIFLKKQPMRPILLDQFTKKRQHRGMERLIKNLFILLACLSYLLPVNAAQMDMESSDAVSHVSCEHDCSNCPDSGAKGCDDECRSHCSSCCSAVGFNTCSEVLLPSSNVMSNTLYNPLMSFGYFENLIKPPIS